jgi:hypothetical protein
MVASGRSTKRSSHTDLSDLPVPQSAVPASPAVKPEVAKKRKKSSSKEKKSAKERKSSIHDLGAKIPKKSDGKRKDKSFFHPDLGIVSSPLTTCTGAASATKG